MAGPRRLVDAHAHVWRRSTPGLEWLAEVPEVDGDRTLEGLREATPAVVDGFVLVQAVNLAEESVWLLEQASGAAEVVAVVGWVDLAARDTAGQLAALAASPGGERLAGIRHLAHLEADPEWLVREDVSRGLSAVQRADLAFDLVLRPWQLETATQVADAHPELLFVLDHLGQPPTDADALVVWERDVRSLARRSNVVAKVSGVASRAEPEAERARLDRLLGVALEAFGPRRLMVGTDWPLVDLADGASAWVESYLAATAGLSAEERRWIDRDTALASYGRGAST
ncbi:amidohydrolase family protein [Herbiconiux sp. CPCC 205716]|uniref:Amidohydrolase family protein n=1 Tax=Herbiconiux gentiana TaxID=2970912 RepID=A0ABT2GCH1_9MICO|nr:amidohydrolase family protein [Herbiconiux gentiana]MCS5713917.1 amidohydrolase family protein [Herbiconiux gentiana]